jgi:NAD+--asparagine ADP-ribosyltransferase
VFLFFFLDFNDQKSINDKIEEALDHIFVEINKKGNIMNDMSNIFKDALYKNYNEVRKYENKENI